MVSLNVRLVRTSNYSESSSEYDSSRSREMIYRRSRTQPHPMSYHHFKYSDSKSSARQAATLVNLTALRSVPPSNPLDPEFETILLNTNNKVIVDKSSPLNSKAELV
jgi:hypothetical protein